MSLLEFCQWVQSTDFFTALRGSWYVYPSIMSLHLAAIAISGGLILVTDLRLLGVALSKYRVSDVVNGLRWPKRVGFVVVATCGILMLGSKAEEYYYNAFVWAKLTLLALVAVHALVFRPRVYNRTAELDNAREMPARAKTAAALSLLLWISIACMGRGIGYIETPVEKIHALLTAPNILR
ncbi:MAG TPA: DUF6644 family protein [Bryobacteraceae bacterium]|nr:DUF6644 family protein [Bryobacteraceae bacterium]